MCCVYVIKLRGHIYIQVAMQNVKTMFSSKLIHPALKTSSLAITFHLAKISVMPGQKHQRITVQLTFCMRMRI